MFHAAFIAGVTLITLALPAIADTSKQKEIGVNVWVHGRLEHGVAAIGGETTGTLINAAGMAWELVLPNDKQELAEQLHGKRVVVSGVLEHRKGVEVSERWIVAVNSLENSTEQDQTPRIYVEASGRLNHGVTAIGGETTGTNIDCGEITLDVDLGRNRELITQAEKLAEEFAIVSGDLEIRTGVEIPARLVIIAKQCKEAKQTMESLNVRVHGSLEHGVAAIGGETTGTLIKAAGVTWELELPSDKQELAEQLHGKQVVVSGVLEHRKGVEVRERWIVAVSSLEKSSEQDQKPRIYVEASGRLNHGVTAIGGETTGTNIVCGEITLDVDLGHNRELITQAEKLAEEFAIVSGDLEIRTGVEIPTRLVIIAKQCKKANQTSDAARSQR